MKPGALEAVFDDLMRTDNPVHQFYGGFGKLERDLPASLAASC